MSGQLIPLYHPGYVVDATVAVKWFAPHEPEAGKARAVLGPFREGRIRLAVPGLFFFLEVGNALGRHPRAREDTVARALKTLWDLGLDVQETDETLLQKANAIAHGYRTSIYDAVYVALAEMRGFPLLTADAELLRRMKAHTIVLPLVSMDLPE